MNEFGSFGGRFLLCTLCLFGVSLPALAQTPGAADKGAHDFDFNIGTWNTHIARLQHPLTGSTTWIQYEGRSVIRKIWNGRAIWVRFIISDMSPTSVRYEQSFSDDGGKTWEVNWIATDTRSAGG
jgi:hypothetical protein